MQTIRDPAADQRVIFRCWDTQPRSVIALFPDVTETHDGKVMCFEHAGQHGAADYAGTIRRSRPARKIEYTPLLKELESRGYKLCIVARR